MKKIKKIHPKKPQIRRSGVNCIVCNKDTSICKCGRNQILEWSPGYYGGEENYCGGY